MRRLRRRNRPMGRILQALRQETGGRMTLEQITDLMQSIAIILLALTLIGGRK